MYKIGICDDEPIFLEEFRKLISDICERHSISYEITLFKDSMGMLRAITATPKYFDILFLDIVMDHLNGMDLAQRIRTMNDLVTVVFITATSGFAIAGYNVRARQYLLKPINNDMLEHLILDDCKRFRTLHLFVESDGIALRLAVPDIEYIETSGRKVLIITKQKTFTVSGKLSNILSNLPENTFVRCHQSFAVNLEKITEIGAVYAILETGKSVPISRAYLKEVQKLFLKRVTNR